MSDTKKMARKEKTQEPVVYIGPDIPDVKQYTVFNNGLPAVLAQRIVEKPFFNSLIVPVTRLAQANAELARKGSALEVLYKKACVGDQRGEK
ncbi:MAG: hypothetical protein K2O97_05665 [Acetatifactor sp.]|jgi:hypothetical protein|nr:hypothetical protein [Acetatifactor sp.]MDE7044492.1 hypothetical protein [Acetatifactor sp.]